MQRVKRSIFGETDVRLLYLLWGGQHRGLLLQSLSPRRADHRQVAKLALPAGLFQINEPIIFGLPVIMNP